jgi:hydroxyethylthiazole kinase-like uncharacterized protein yjeF
MRTVDRLAATRYGIASLILMENAAMACFRTIARIAKGKKSPVLIIVGKGNNGGDGLAIARHLFVNGWDPRIISLQPKKGFQGDCLAQYVMVRKLKIPCFDFSRKIQRRVLRAQLKRCALVVDALFGSGLTRPVEGRFLKIIKAVNASGRPVLAVDIPSGLNADTGEPMPIAVRARWTVTFGLMKKGFLNPLAACYVGKVIVETIGLPQALLNRYGRTP